MTVTIQIDEHGEAKILNLVTGGLEFADTATVLTLYALLIGTQVKPGEFVDDGLMSVAQLAFGLACGEEEAAP